MKFKNRPQCSILLLHPQFKHPFIFFGTIALVFYEMILFDISKLINTELENKNIAK
jgi:hypothetical protein